MTGYIFADRVRHGLQLSRNAAVRLNHEYVGTEHILLGLLEVGGVAVTALESLPVSPDGLRKRVLSTVEPGSRPVAVSDLPYTARAKKAMGLAMVEARELHHPYIGTEHIMLGLLREEKGIAARVLEESGVTPERFREEVVRLLGTPASAARHRDAVTPAGPVTVTILVDHPDGRLVAVKFPDVSGAISYLTNLRAQQAAG
jgi:ATP-dependent Clp protease ATP-binding subunit ClpC